MSKIAVEKRIMAFGTFDGLHKGHIHFFKQARKLAQNPYLIVSIARDKNIQKIKGSRPRNTEKKRMELVKKTGLADRVVLAGLNNHIPHIKKEKPDIIALGYDQVAYVKNLKRDLRDPKIKIFRLKAYKPHIYKNHLLHVAKAKGS